MHELDETEYDESLRAEPSRCWDTDGDGCCPLCCPSLTVEHEEGCCRRG